MSKTFFDLSLVAASPQLHLKAAFNTYASAQVPRTNIDFDSEINSMDNLFYRLKKCLTFEKQYQIFYEIQNLNSKILMYSQPCLFCMTIFRK